MNPEPERPLLTAVLQYFDRRGWRDDGGAALQVARHVAGGGARSATAIGRRLPRSFLIRNGLQRAAAAAALTAAIDTFAAMPAGGERRLLLLSADPADLDRLRVQAEQRLIRTELERSGALRSARIEVRPGLLATDLARYLLEVRPTVVHFSGHGDHDGIYGEDDGGQSSLVSARALGMLFARPAIAEKLMLVVLSSCYSEAQAVAIQNSVPVVIGMRGSVLDETALAFSRGLYMALGQGETVREAFEFGRAAVATANLAEEDLPRLLDGAGPKAASLRLFSAQLESR